MGGVRVNSETAPLPPPWEVMVLVSHLLDPRTLAIASCVCKSWSISMSSDTLWEPICSSHFPSLSAALRRPSVSYRRLYALALSSSARRLRVTAPSRPRLSLSHLLFAVDICTAAQNSFDSKNIVSLVVPGDEITRDGGGMFKFDLKVDDCECERALEEVRISWNVVVKGWGGVFTMMDCDGKVSLSPGAEGWFSEELPSPGCCSFGAGATSGVVADLKVGFCSRRESCGGGRLSLGILSILNWRYITLEDGLRYLQHFLLPL